METLQRKKSERRNFLRVNKDSKVAFKKMDRSFESDDFNISEIKNISGSGLLFDSDKKYRIGDLLHLKLTLLGLKKTDKELMDIDDLINSEKINMAARVVRVEEIEEDHIFEIGVTFIEIPG